MATLYNPPHPGEVLRDGVFADTGLTVTDFAKRLGVTRVALRTKVAKIVRIDDVAACGKSNPYVGSDFEDFLAEEGRLQKSSALAIKRVLTE